MPLSPAEIFRDWATTMQQALCAERTRTQQLREALLALAVRLQRGRWVCTLCQAPNYTHTTACVLSLPAIEIEIETSRSVFEVEKGDQDA